VLERALPIESLEPGSRSAIIDAQTVLALADGDRDRALALAQEALEAARAPGFRNEVAYVTWWVGCLFGPEAVGGTSMLEEARETLEENHWLHAIEEPQIDLEAVQRLHVPTG
jgi:hypothetical protein